MSTTARKRSASAFSSPDGSPVKKQQTLASSNPDADSPMTDVAHTPSSDSSSSADAQEEVVVPTKTALAPKKSKAVTKPPPIAELFTQHQPKLAPLPKFNQTWGIVPIPGPEGPKSYPDQPPARTSNAQTVPPLWEDRRFRFQKGSRFVKTFRRGEQVGKNAPANLDQEGNLVLCLIDMRAKSTKDPTPRRKPCYYNYKDGFCLPKDWNSKQAIKALNDRRQQAIDRVTMDPPWTEMEREYLAEIFEDYPDASIKEVAERFNWRFKDQDFAKPTAFSWEYISAGRTTESIRYEYLTGKHKYDIGEIPKKKEMADKSKAGLKARKESRLVEKFGKRNNALNYDEDEDSDAEGRVQSRTTKKTVRTAHAHTDGASDEDSDDSGDELSSVPSPLLHAEYDEQIPLSEDDEELLDLAGWNDPQPED